MENLSADERRKSLGKFIGQDEDEEENKIKIDSSIDYSEEQRSRLENLSSFVNTDIKPAEKRQSDMEDLTSPFDRSQADTVTRAAPDIEDAPEFLGTIGREVMEPGEVSYEEDFTALDHLLYAPARMGAKITRDVYSATDLGLRGMRATLDFLGMEDTPNIDKTIDTIAGIEDNHRLLNYVDELAEHRRINAYDQSTAKGILNDITDTGIDLSTLIMSMKMIGAPFGGETTTAGGIKSVGGKSIAERLGHFGRMAGHAFSTTPGDVEERLESAQMRLLYNLTPFVAQGTGAVGAGAVMLDFGLNAALTSPQYKEAYEKAGGFNEEFLSMAVPQVTTDLAMAWNTRGLPKNIAEKTWEKKGSSLLRDAYGLDRGESREVFSKMHDHASAIDRGEADIGDRADAMVREFDNLTRDDAIDILEGVTRDPQTPKEMQMAIIDKDETIGLYRDILKDDDYTETEKQQIRERMDSTIQERNQLRDRLFEENSIHQLRERGIEDLQSGDYMARDRMQKLEELLVEYSDERPEAEYIGVREEIARERAFRQEAERVRTALDAIDERVQRTAEEIDRAERGDAPPELLERLQRQEQMLKDSQKQTARIMAERDILKDVKLPDKLFYEREDRLIREGDFAKPDAYKNTIENMEVYRDELKVELDRLERERGLIDNTENIDKKIETLQRLHDHIEERETNMMEWYRQNHSRNDEVMNVPRETEIEIAERLETLDERLGGRAHPIMHQRYVHQIASDMGIDMSRPEPESFAVKQIVPDRVPTYEEAGNLGYHTGDLGKSESLFSVDVPDKSTGHFGTGTYFFGGRDAEGFERHAETRPVYEIDLSDYNLYRPQSAEDARQLHSFLKEINSFVANPERDASEIIRLAENQFSHLFRDDVENIRDYMNDFIGRTMAEKADATMAERQTMDSASTKFMKEQGFEGIDVRGIKGLDNSYYGSVLYDLKDNAIVDFFRDTDALALIDRKVRNTLYDRPVSVEEVMNIREQDLTLRDYQKLDDISIQQMIRDRGYTTPDSMREEIDLLRESVIESEEGVKLGDHDRYWETIINTMDINKDSPEAEFLYRELMERMYDADDVNLELIRKEQGITFEKIQPESVRAAIREQLSEGYTNDYLVRTKGEERKYANDDFDQMVRDINKTLENKPDSVFVIMGRPEEQGIWGKSGLKAEIRANMVREETGEKYDIYDMHDVTFEKALANVTRIDELERARANTNDDAERNQLNKEIEKLIEKQGRLQEESELKNTEAIQKYVEERYAKQQEQAKNFFDRFLNWTLDEEGNRVLKNTEANWEHVREFRISPENREKFPLSLREMKDFIYDEIAPIHRGRDLSDGASGVFDAYQRLIDVHRLDDVSTVKHEVGHAIDMHYDITRGIAKEYNKPEGEQSIPANKIYDELMELYYSSFDNQTYSNSRRPFEGFAEFFKSYTSDKDWTRQLAPRLTRHFENVVERDSEMAEVINTFTDMGHRWANMTSAQRVQAHITRQSKAGWDLSARDKVAEMFKDKATSLRRLEMDYIKESKNIEAQDLELGNLDTLPELPITMSPYRTYYRYRASYKPLMDSFLHRGIVDPHTMRIKEGSKGLMEILEPVKEYIGDEEKIGELETFLVALHALEREAQGKHSFANIKMDGVQKLIESVGEVGRQKFVNVAKEIKDWRDGQLDFMEYYGMISSEDVSRIKGTYNFAIPMERALDERKSTFNISGERLSGSPALVRQAFGSDALILDPLQTMIRNTNYMVRESLKNEVKQNIYRLGQAKGMGRWVEDVTPDSTRHEEKAMDIAEKELESLGIKEFMDRYFGNIPDKERKSMEMHVEAWLDQVESRSKAEFLEKFYDETGLAEYFKERVLSREFMELTNQSDVHQVRVDGRTRLFRVRNENLNRFLNNEMGEMTRSNNPLLRFLEKTTGLFKAGAVIAPRFPLRNLYRDQFTAMFNTSKDAGWFIPVRETITGLIDRAPEGTSDAHWRNLGGSRGGIGDYAFRIYDKDFAPFEILEKDEGFQLFGMLQNIARWSEDGTRKGHFYRLYKEKDIDSMPREKQRLHALEAAEAARAHINLDYQRKGYVTEMIDKTGPFIAPWVNSFFKTMDLMRTRPAETIAKGLAMYTLPYMLNYWVNRDDEEFLELPVWRKLLSFPVNTGEGFIYLPVPFFPAQMFGAIPTALMESIHQEDRALFEETFKSIPNLVLPDPTPPIALSLVETMTNTSFFSDRPIVPASEQRLPKEMQYGEYTSNIAIGLSKGLQTLPVIRDIFDLSPRQIDNIARGVGASVGSDLLASGDLISGKIGFGEYMSRIFPFTGEHYSQTRSIDRFYSERERAQGIIQTFEAQIKRHGKSKDYTREEYAKAKNLYSNYNNYASQMSELRRQKDWVNNHPEMTQQEKDVRLERIDMRILNLARMALGEDRIIND